MVAMRDKIRNIKPFKQGPAQRTEEDYQDNKFNEKIKELENRRLVDQTTQENISTPEDDSPTQQASTLISNPFDGVRALANQTVGGIQNMFGIDKGFRDGPYGSLTSLRRSGNTSNRVTFWKYASSRYCC